MNLDDKPLNISAQVENYRMKRTVSWRSTKPSRAHLTALNLLQFP